MVSYPLITKGSLVRLPYSIEEVAKSFEASTKGHTRSEDLRDRFHGPYPCNKNGQLQLVDEPTMFFDTEDKVAGWYIPHMTSRDISVGS